MSFELSPPLYNALQKLVNRNYDTVGALIQSMKTEHPGRALEVGCGTGSLSRFFEPQAYVGIDLDSKRINLARDLHPQHEFTIADATTLDPSWLAQFAFVFCHAFIHHIDDSGVKRIIASFENASRLAGAPVHLLIMEPLLPENTFSNVPGYVLGKLDRGRYMRKCSRFKALLEHKINRFEITQGPWYWPLPGANCVLEFRASHEKLAAETSQNGARSRSARA